MTGKTSIEWATAVWNPTTGCTRVSAGCDNCYAFALHDKRYAANLKVVGLTGEPYDGMTFRQWLESGRFRADHPETVGKKGGLSLAPQYDRPFSRVQLLYDRLGDPLRDRKPERYFVDSMADLFHEDIPDEFIDRVFGTMSAASQHTFLVLTKRPERMRDYCSRHDIGLRWARAGSAVVPIVDPAMAVDWSRNGLPNVWLGTSVEDQDAADKRIPDLLATPAAVRFLSCEPLLGPVNLRQAIGYRSARGVLKDGEWAGLRDCGLHWVIIGGESGPRSRPMDVAWARDIVGQCRHAGIMPFVKQMGRTYIDRDGWAALKWTGQTVRPDGLVKPSDPHGGDMTAWPDDLRVREWPKTAYQHSAQQEGGVVGG